MNEGSEPLCHVEIARFPSNADADTILRAAAAYQTISPDRATCSSPNLHARRRRWRTSHSIIMPLTAVQVCAVDESMALDASSACWLQTLSLPDCKNDDRCLGRKQLPPVPHEAANIHPYPGFGRPSHLTGCSASRPAPIMCLARLPGWRICKHSAARESDGASRPPFACLVLIHYHNLNVLSTP